MLTAREFIEETLNKIDDEQKRSRFYLNVLTYNIDKQFIIDLNKIPVKLISPEKVLTEILDFVKFTTTKPDTNDLNALFANYLVS